MGLGLQKRLYPTLSFNGNYVVAFYANSYRNMIKPSIVNVILNRLLYGCSHSQLGRPSKNREANRDTKQQSI